MMKKIRNLALLAAALSISMAVLLLAGCGELQTQPADPPRQAEQDTVRIGTMNLINGEIVAQYEKWYEQELGMKVNVIFMDNSQDIIRALERGDIDFGETGSTMTAYALARGVDIDVIWIADVIGSAEALVAKPGSGINSLQDLPGKTVGAPFGTTVHYSLLRGLKLEGVDEDRVNIVDLTPGSIRVAWQKGEIDAAYVWFPVLGQLLHDGGYVVIDSEELSHKGIVTADLINVRHEFAEKHPDVVKKFIALQIRGNELIENEKERAAHIIASHLKTQEAEVALQLDRYEYLTVEEEVDYMNSVLGKNLKLAADFYKEQKLLGESQDYEFFCARIRPEFIREAAGI